MRYPFKETQSKFKLTQRIQTKYSCEPGAIWFFTELHHKTGTLPSKYSGGITPIVGGKVLFFVIAMQDDSMRVSSKIFVGRASSFAFPLLLLLYFVLRYGNLGGYIWLERYLT